MILSFEESIPASCAELYSLAVRGELVFHCFCTRRLGVKPAANDLIFIFLWLCKSIGLLCVMWRECGALVFIKSRVMAMAQDYNCRLRVSKPRLSSSEPSQAAFKTMVRSQRLIRFHFIM